MVFGPFFLTLDTLGQARTLLPQLCIPNRAELVNLGQLLPRIPASSSRLQYQTEASSPHAIRVLVGMPFNQVVNESNEAF